MAGADRSVRLAWAEDVPAIAVLHRARLATELPQVAATIPPDAELRELWRLTITRPPTAAYRVLVALDRATVVGYVLTAPASDPDCAPGTDGEILDLTVAAGAGADGHDARLWQAAVDTLKADGFRRAVTWLTSTDDAQRGALVAAGWAPDGAHRSLDFDGTGEVLVRQIRLHTDIS